MNEDTYTHYLSLLTELLQIKSISTDPAFDGEIVKTAEWLAKTLESSGFTTEIISGYGNPIVYAHYEVDPEAETVLIYGHYDVQPASINDGWKSDPFVLSERDGRLFGRGVVDNKGQFMIYVAVIKELIAAKNLKYNIKFVIEGDEETGG
ncbi:M20/M25/M40 family metallo-hydrolase, partial [candidate division WWE3 bacterium]|nr:M20/M25/M40 family metallo-hydrolase [candidate division WWE3 bacterium]